MRQASDELVQEGIKLTQEGLELERRIGIAEQELNDFSEEEVQRFWDKLLGFEKHYDGEQGP